MLAKINIRSGVLIILLGLLINNAFSKTVGFSSGFIEFGEEDSLKIEVPDSLKSDSLVDSDISPNAPKFRVKYTAKDSIDFDNANQIVYLFGEAKVEYGEISLQADRIKVFIGENEVHAFGKRDSTGKMIEKVLFDDAGEAFEAPEMAYNFTTKKGRIIQATTQQGEMYLLSDKGKKMPNNDIFLKTGKITTCDAEHPHFYFEASKLKVIPGKKIVVGPTNLVIRELRTPIVIPFGMFPNNQKKQSGILIPGYTTGALGYGLDQLGFHWAINDYVHAEFLTDIYFSGTFRLTGDISYKKKYKYNGKVWFKYNDLKSSPNSIDINRTQDFNLKWSYNQEPQAHPKRKFSVSINAKSPTFNQTQNISSTSIVSTAESFSSSNANWRWSEKKWNINLNSRLDQSFTQNTIDLTLPSLTFNVNPIKVGVFNMSGNVVANNKVSRGDSAFFKEETFNEFRNGAKANFKINISERLTLAKYINVTAPSFSWNSYMITEEIRKSQGADGLNTDTLNKLVHAYDMSLGNFGLNTKIFGTYLFKDGMYLKGFRHVVTPSISFTYRPDFFIDAQDINQTEFDTIAQRDVDYSKYGSNLYRPNASKAASVNFSLDQNLQTKYRSKKDSTGRTYENLNIINAFRINTSYNALAEEFKWSNLSFALNTTPLFLRNLSVQGSVSPYALDDEGYQIDSLLWKSKQIGRLTSFRVQTEIDLKRLNFLKWFYNADKAPKDNFGWSLNLKYTYTYSKPGLTPTINQSLGIRGDVNLSKNWSFAYNLPVNMKSGKLASTGFFNFKRKLHCWEMTFNYFPFQSDTWYTFTIRPKAGLLQDLKFDKTRQGDRVF